MALYLPSFYICFFFFFLSNLSTYVWLKSYKGKRIKYIKNIYGKDSISLTGPKGNRI